MPGSTIEFAGVYSINLSSFATGFGSSVLLSSGNQIQIDFDPSTPEIAFVTFKDTKGRILEPLAAAESKGVPFKMAVGNLRYEFTLEGKPAICQISLFQGLEPGFRAIYGLLEFGDPEGIGVFGADEDPDPEDPSS